MHIPYIKKVFKDSDIKLVPIVVGSVSFEKAQAIAGELADYFKDEENFFVVSTDFCHWGVRFGYMPYDEEYCKERGVDCNIVSDYIRALDHEGIELVEKQSGKDFKDYLARTKNTI
mmetsp:Transcript_20411/g.23575  ORF Transcript_20411/g.23575 Transcript_20411/m.23575 type:complete len:116 (-) Transcript_20411:165-512(-)